MRAHLRRDPLHLLGCAQRHQLHSTDQALRPPPYAPFARPRRAAALPLRHGTMCYLPTGIKPVRWELLATKVYSPPTGRGSLPSRSATSAPTACRLAPSPSPKLTATMTATATATGAQSGLHRRAYTGGAHRAALLGVHVPWRTGPVGLRAPLEYRVAAPSLADPLRLKDCAKQIE